MVNVGVRPPPPAARAAPPASVVWDFGIKRILLLTLLALTLEFCEYINCGFTMDKLDETAHLATSSTIY